MGVEEQLAEKTLDFVEDQGLKAAELVVEHIIPGTVKFLSPLTEQGLDKIQEFLDGKDIQRLDGIESPIGDVELEKLQEMAQKLSTRSKYFIVPQQDVETLASLLRDKKVMFAYTVNSETGENGFSVLQKDVLTIQRCIRTVQILRNGVAGELALDQFFNKFSYPRTGCFYDMDATEQTLFRHYAQRENLTFCVAAQNNEKGTALGTVFFAEKDWEKVRRVMLHIGWDIASRRHGDKCRQQVMEYVISRDQVRKICVEGNQEMFVVSRENSDNYIHIKPEGFDLYRNKRLVKQVSVTGTKDYVEACVEQCEKQRDSVLVSPEVYHEGLTPHELHANYSLHLHPLDWNEDREIARQSHFANLLTEKEGPDSPTKDYFGVRDMNVSLSEYDGDVFYHDEEERSSEEQDFEDFKQAAFYRRRHDMDAMTLDVQNARLADLMQERVNKHEQERADRERKKEQEKATAASTMEVKR